MNMKSKLSAGIAATALIATLAACNSGTANPTTAAPSSESVAVTVESYSSTENSTLTNQQANVSDVSNTAAATAITDAEAQAAALEHAGLTEADVTWINTHLDWDDGRQIYEVEFISGSTEYDYDIDAATGQIISFDADIENYGQNPGAPAPAEVTVDEATAKEQALAMVPGAADSNLRIRLDYDDGRPVYEGTIIYNERKYEFEIDAADGTMREWSEESVYED